VGFIFIAWRFRTSPGSGRRFSFVDSKRGKEKRKNMKRGIVVFTLAFVAGVVLLASQTAGASPPRILKVDARAPKTLETLHDLGLRLYGQTDRFYLVEDSPGAQASLTAWGLTVTSLYLSSNLPLYLIFLPREDILGIIAPPASLLYTDSQVALVQMDKTTTRKVSQKGGELVFIPDVPHPIYLPLVSFFPRPSMPDTFIQRLVDKVNQDSIRAKMQRLQDFRSRSAYTDSCRSAEQYLFDYMNELGLDSVVFDSCSSQGIAMRNIIGTRLGRVNPRKIFIICGHMDSESPGRDTLAPGANDNASGTAMALEVARVIARENLEATVKLIAFTGEEIGLVGSRHYAQLMRSRNADIIGVLNFDMIAWPGDSFGVDIYADSSSLSLARFEDRMAEMYTMLGHSVISKLIPDSDHTAFYEQGFSAILSIEKNWLHDNVHTPGDTLGRLSMPMAAEVAKMGVASLATLAISPAPPDDFVLRDVGSGGTLEATWLPSPNPDLEGYKLYWGTASQTYTDSVTLGRVTSHRISGLQNGTRYYATTLAFDSTGHDGISAPEKSAVPGIVPAPPSGFAALPFYFGMRLTWLPNTERDFAGYNLYRSTTSGSNYLKLNTALLPDSVYRDSSLLSDTMYYYVATAVDTGGNESGYSSEVRGRPITLNHGILLVDETRNGTGQRGSPSDAQQDAYYHYLLQGSRYQDWDVTQQGVPMAGDIGPYSTLVWHADDYQEQLVFPAVQGLANYLSYGGRLWMVGWKPIFGLMNRTGIYPYTFSSGQFPYDYLHLSRSTESQVQDFIGATGLLSYPNISTDSLKINASWQGRMQWIDTAIPRDAESVLTFNSASGDTAFQGKPVGVRWLSGPYRVIFFGFPFYFMKDQEARQVVIKVLQDLGEPVGVEAGISSLPLKTTLLPVHPNPFRGSARIEYSLAAKGRVRLSVYNVSGQLVRKLVDVVQSPGRYSIFWDGRDREAHRLPSGVYFYHLQTESFSDTKKAVVVR
jgi:hypothetical protein